MPITALPTPPNRIQGAATFAGDGDTFLAALPTFATQANALAETVNVASSSAVSAAATALAAANFKGAYSALTGSLAIPASTSHGGYFWLLVENSTDVTTDVPGVSSKWEVYNFDTSSSGSAETWSISTNTTLTLERVHVITATADNLDVTLPGGMPEGGPIFVIKSHGNYPFHVVDSDSEPLFTVDPGQIVTVFLSDATTKKYHWHKLQATTYAMVPDRVETAFESASTATISSAVVDTNKVLVVYTDAGNSNKGTAIVLTIDDYDIEVGVPYVWCDGAASGFNVCKLRTDAGFVSYINPLDSSYLSTIALTVTGTGTSATVEAGTPVRIVAATGSTPTPVYLQDDNVAVVYSTSSNMYVVAATVSGTVVTVGSPNGGLAMSNTTGLYGYSFPVAALSSSLIVFGYLNTSAYICAATISGTTATAGSSVAAGLGDNAGYYLLRLSDTTALMTYGGVATDPIGVIRSCTISVSGTVITKNKVNSIFSQPVGPSIYASTYYIDFSTVGIVCHMADGYTQYLRYGVIKLQGADTQYMLEMDGQTLTSVTGLRISNHYGNNVIATYAGGSSYGVAKVIKVRAL